tara:strand:+ start:310 stop:750 length:441 start_codon:yes stop_codon:yes gene_type:complete
MTTEVLRSIQQLRAHYALQKVMAAKQLSGEAPKRFKSYSNTLPAMIQMNGIGQALAFAYQKSNGTKVDEAKAWQQLFDLVSEWLLTNRKIWGNSEISDNSEKYRVLQALAAGSQEQYQLAQAEAQALLCWVKDFARAEIVGEAEDI